MAADSVETKDAKYERIVLFALAIYPFLWGMMQTHIDFYALVLDFLAPTVQSKYGFLSLASIYTVPGIILIAFLSWDLFAKTMLFGTWFVVGGIIAYFFKIFYGCLLTNACP